MLPYGVRPRPHAPVSTPLHWEEVPGSSPTDFTIRTVLPAYTKPECFAPLLENPQSLQGAWSRLGLPRRY